MKSAAAKWAKFVLRWGIAVVGIWWVVSQINFRDRVWILDQKNYPVAAKLSAYADRGDQSAVFEIYDPVTAQPRTISRREVVNLPDQKELKLSWSNPAATQPVDAEKQGKLLALDLTDDLKHVQRLLVEDASKGEGI